MGKAIIVTGGRDYPEREHVFSVLNELAPTSLFVGDCPTGVDKYARDWYSQRREDGEDIWMEVFEADWSKHGKAAGPIRNGEMVKFGKEHEAFVVAFPGGRGTLDCVRQALKAGLEVQDTGLSAPKGVQDGEK